MTDTPVPSPTETLTATPTDTPTPTATPTLNYYVEMLTPGGEPARMVREISAADYLMILLLLAILLSLWGMYITNRLKGEKPSK